MYQETPPTPAARRNVKPQTTLRIVAELFFVVSSTNSRTNTVRPLPPKLRRGLRDAASAPASSC